MNDLASLPPVEGGCLCGAVRYRATPTHREGYCCHCRMCQLAFGNARAAFINLRKTEVKWTRGAPAYYASSSFAKRGFCAHCGTPLSFAYEDSERMDLSVGSLDEPSAFKPTSHFSIETRVAAWHVDDGLPGQRLDAFAPIMERWKRACGNDVKPGLEATRS